MRQKTVLNKESDNRYEPMFEQELKKIIQNLKSNYDPEKIILFGSLTKGKLSRGSDIDLVIIKQTKDNPWKRAAQVDRFIEHAVPVDVLVYTPDEIEERLKMNDFFVKDILEKGKVLYERGI